MSLSDPTSRWSPALVPDAILDRPNDTGDRDELFFEPGHGQLVVRGQDVPADDLTFEPSTGRLLVRPEVPDAPCADAVSAVAMARSGFFVDPNPAETGNVLHRMETISDGEADGDELIFDPSTGRLLVRPKGAAAPSADAVSAVTMARSGFFAVALPRRLKAEQIILNRYLPGFVVEAATARGTLTSNSGKVYSVRVDLPAFPNRMPEAFVTSPVLVMANGRQLSTLGGSHTMHMLGTDGAGFPRVCHWHPDSWTASHTLYQVLIKVRIWLEAWEGHVRTGLPLDHWLRSV